MPTLAPTLTDRQVELLTLLAAGHTTLSAADVMGISKHTAHNHAADARAVLRARTIAQACIIAREMGLIPPQLPIISIIVP